MALRAPRATRSCRPLFSRLRRTAGDRVGPRLHRLHRLHRLQAIELDPGSSILYSNRSGALAASASFDAALADADRCVSLRPDWAKGHTRRASALHGMRRFLEAVQARGAGGMGRRVVAESGWRRARGTERSAREGRGQRARGGVVRPHASPRATRYASRRSPDRYDRFLREIYRPHLHLYTPYCRRTTTRCGTSLAVRFCSLAAARARLLSPSKPIETG